jgi:lactate dehydrogenase-like 2-hydroxyacid dehydrogenase
LAMAMLAAENLLAALEGRRPPTPVNPEIYT